MQLRDNVRIEFVNHDTSVLCVPSRKQRYKHVPHLSVVGDWPQVKKLILNYMKEADPVVICVSSSFPPLPMARSPVEING
jgi:hypothetical protein